MGLDLWFQDDVARILASTYEAMQASTGGNPGGGAELETYRQGFADALRAVAVAFGVAAPAAGPEASRDARLLAPTGSSPAGLAGNPTGSSAGGPFGGTVRWQPPPGSL